MLRDRTETSFTEDAPDSVERFLRENAPTRGENATVPLLGVRAHTDLFHYWCGLPRLDGIPDAADFNPAAAKAWLPDIAILAVSDLDEISHRLVGTGVASRLGYDATGANLLDFIAPGYRRQCSRDMHEVVYRPCALQARYMTHYVSGRIGRVQSLYLPLNTPAGRAPRILSVHTPEGALVYRKPAAKPAFASTIDRMIWIDIGFGVPGTA